jgi:hypothetical protein
MRPYYNRPLSTKTQRSAFPSQDYSSSKQQLLFPVAQLQPKIQKKKKKKSTKQKAEENRKQKEKPKPKPKKMMHFKTAAAKAAVLFQVAPFILPTTLPSFQPPN